MKALRSIAEVERELRGEGFFEGGADGLVADLYLGYGLSRALRRTRRPRPPEPCPLPLAACRPAGGRAAAAGRPVPRRRLGADLDDEASYAAAVEAVRGGDRRRRRLPGEPRPASLGAASTATRPGWPRRWRRCGRSQPRPFAGDGWTIVSASPELFLARRGRAGLDEADQGHAARSASDGLADAAKDAAEHVMIVDLERNDLSRVCEPGSVRWPELMAEHELAGVVHLVSTVEGRLREDVGLAELLGGDVPGRLGHGRAEDLGDRPHRRARAGRARRLDGRARRVSARTATSSSR